MRFGRYLFYMNIIISNNRDRPIYEQIVSQIKHMIIKRELSPGDNLPSMRILAKSIRVSVITVQRAYEELQRDGFIEMEVGRGTFVLERNEDFYKEEQYKKIQEYLKTVVTIAKENLISLNEMQEILKTIYMEDDDYE